MLQHGERDQVILSTYNTRYIKYKVKEMRGGGLKMPHKAQVINKSPRSYVLPFTVR